ncbi:hypothetical protein [Neokomagataea anthophila]|uniref:Uncharacterized protein n=1 Tax=Neokomagataea anthophila TaxID=2826925 RepID=A0ABS5EAB2_9PROT|nr:hypothetical protein [Neokomagataea anthophila]MBR0560746.1 hypothetical protein [Neokomagataea anthophila]
MTDLSDELAAKKAAIRKARNSTKPTVPSEQVLAILKADLARVQSAIDVLPHEERRAG